MNEEQSDATDTNLIKKENWGELALRFVEALEDDNNSGNFTVAAAQAGVNRPYVYELFAKFPEMESYCRALRISKKRFNADVAENKLMKLVNEENVAAVIFALKKYNPEEFGDRGIDQGAGPLPITHTLSPELQAVVKRLTDQEHE